MATRKIFLIIISVLLFSSNAMSTNHIVSPSYEGKAFGAAKFPFRWLNKKAADKICFILLDRKSFRASSFTTEEKSLKDLSIDFPKTFEVFPGANPSSAKLPWIVDGIWVDGKMDEAGAYETRVEIATKMIDSDKKGLGKKIKIFSSVTCK
ncbi:MAG: hypothetical protein QE271_09000 [Bacteriovoracaceae bacterium]|nr:hypothetical protein [Bacteriovoracaceae bacterium]